ncbi:MAG: DUF4412 domain-containing protein [Ignavibacteria bacterium]|nr:DUF4412 domain-containing protein [Ignavibacteria bacterium]MCU7503605.1 DUF4412 domain-containing protein [Ignavibacteria bacterium]MCU7516741.1 DUF4412 domain-containing protein [Ignavibacteria bacterium]
MKKIKMLLFAMNIVILFSCLNSILAQDRNEKFEGTVELKLHGKKSSNEIKYYAKGNMARVEMGDNAGKQASLPLQGTVIFKEDRMFILMPSRKTYLEKPLSITTKLNEISRKEDLDNRITRTGEEKDILGYKAAKWLVKTNSGELELWSTQELGNFLFFQNQDSTAYPEWFRKVTSGGFFPLLVVQRDLNGDEINRLEVTDVKKGNVEDNYFEIPQDFKRTEGGRESRHGGK